MAFSEYFQTDFLPQLKAERYSSYKKKVSHTVNINSGHRTYSMVRMSDGVMVARA